MSEAMHAHAHAAPADRSYLPWGMTALVGAAVVIVLGNTDLKPGENGGTGPLIISLVVCAVVAALLYARLVPGSTNPAKTGLTFGVLAVLSLGAFWSGLPVVLGPVAVALGRRAEAGGQAKAAIVLGALATVVGFVGGVLGATLG